MLIGSTDKSLKKEKCIFQYMSEVVITKSNRKDKKMQAIIDGKKTVHFGQKNASDYTIHNDTERKERYIKRQ
jgi:hypothetical protein